MQYAFVAFALWVGAGSILAAPNLSARLDRETISLGENVTLSLVFEDVAPQSTPSLPNIPNVRLGPVSTSQNISFVNGMSSRSITFSFELMPTQAGEIAIPKIEVRIGGQTLATEPLKLTVLKSGAAGPPTADSAVFLKLIVAKNQMFVGELVPMELQLYVEEGENLQMPQLPSEGFTLGRFSQAPTVRTRINNRLYHVLTFKSFIVPAKTGPLALGPATMSLNVPDRTRRSNFLFFQSTRPVTVASEAQSLQVLPLPTENVPPGFSGAVGDYTLAVNASPADVAVGDPITVRIQIRGRGLLDALNLPSQPDWREFKFYPPSGKVEAADPLGSSGVKTFEQVVVPQNSEIKSLPPVVFSFFDPVQKQYRTVSSSPVALTVRPAGASPSVPTNFASAPDASAPPPPQDIVHIKPHLGELAAVGVPLVQQRWFLALQAVPVLLWLSLLARRKYTDRLAANPRLRRQKEVARTVRAGLRELREFAAANQADPFFAALFRLLQEQLGERLDLPASAITEAVIDERLRDRELSAETFSALHELFQACNIARYARHNGQELALLIPKLERTLQDLQNLEL